MAAPEKKKSILGLPNLLTLSRMAVIPVLVLLMSFPSRMTRAVATLLFVIACVTDYFDGYLARRYNDISPVGKLLDPMADKLLVMAALVMLVALEESAVPAWVVVIILGRDMMVTSLRGMASAKGVVIQAEELGKYKMILQTFAVTGLILHYPYFWIDFHFGGMYFLWVSLVLSLWSGFAYFRKFWSDVLRSG